MSIQLLFLLLLLVLAGFVLRHILKAPPITTVAMPEVYQQILQQQVAFYRALDAKEKTRFEKQLMQLLSSIQIEGIGTVVEDLDRVLIGASGIIPIFGFNNWQYSNLTHVLVYPEHFNEQFDMQQGERRVMGMVGDGPMHNHLVISRPALREGFSNETDKQNTAIHEFVHLLDNMDGATDGIPELLLDKQFTIPWINLMHEQIRDIVKNRSDINPYGATSKTEFFAVAAEYFFERPALLQTKHPELFQLLENIFDQTPKVAGRNQSTSPDRNDGCPCGSGKKYKRCHGKNQ